MGAVYGLQHQEKNSYLPFTRFAGVDVWSLGLKLRCISDVPFESHTNVADQGDGLLAVAAYFTRQWCVFLHAVFRCVIVVK